MRRVGLVGAAKSIYNSARYTSKPLSLVLHSKVITDISPTTEFNINNYFAMGIDKGDPTHPRLARSKLSTMPKSIISHTGESAAKIGPGSVLHVEGEFTMGDSYINGDACIICNEKISIGNGAAIAWNVNILDSDHHQIVINGNRKDHTMPIEIKDRVWIGHDVSIHKGVTIGEGSVVASNSVVKSDVPPYTLVAGSPVKVVREGVDWEGIE